MLLTIYSTEWPILCWCAVKKLLTHSSLRIILIIYATIDHSIIMMMTIMIISWLQPAKRASGMDASSRSKSRTKSSSRIHHRRHHGATESRDLDSMNVDVDSQLHCDSSITVLQQQFLAVTTTTTSVFSRKW